MVVMRNNSFEEIYEVLKKSKKVAMTLHAAPDGDSLGSCTAMKYFLERDFNCKVELVSYDSLSSNLMSLKISKEINFGKDISDLNFDDFDLILMVDVSSSIHISSKLRKNFVLPKNKVIVNIDHHHTNEYYGNYNYIDAKSPSACSVLIDFLKATKVKFNQELSDRLIVGVCTDSGFFTYDTNPDKAMRDVLFLVDNGADYLNSALRPILYSEPLRMKRYFALLINNLKISKNGKFAWSFISQTDIKKLGLNEAEVRLGGNELQFIDEFDFIFTFADLGNYIKGSFRSKKGVDVSLFAKELGGGGHKQAASFILSSTPMNQVERIILEAVEKVGIHKSN